MAICLTKDTFGRYTIVNLISMIWSRRTSYKGEHVCITGGSDGLGFALAKLFVEEGANVSIIARTLSKLEEARVSLEGVAAQKGLECKVAAVPGDCSKFECIKEAMLKVRSVLGVVDVLICNAGTAAPGRFIETDIADFESQVQLNYLGTVYTVKSVVEEMIQRKKGEIVLISSAVGVLGLAGSRHM